MQAPSPLQSLNRCGAPANLPSISGTYASQQFVAKNCTYRLGAVQGVSVAAVSQSDDNHFPYMEWDFAKQLQRIEDEALSVANFNMPREGFFRGVLRSAFARAFEFARLVHKHKTEDADETGFFLAAGLRGIAEDLISLRLIRKLKRADR